MKKNQQGEARRHYQYRSNQQKRQLGKAVAFEVKKQLSDLRESGEIRMSYEGYHERAHEMLETVLCTVDKGAATVAGAYGATKDAVTNAASMAWGWIPSAQTTSESQEQAA